jgi:hypothetical protein
MLRTLVLCHINNIGGRAAVVVGSSLARQIWPMVIVRLKIATRLELVRLEAKIWPLNSDTAKLTVNSRLSNNWTHNNIILYYNPIIISRLRKIPL